MRQDDKNGADAGSFEESDSTTGQIDVDQPRRQGGPFAALLALTGSRAGQIHRISNSMTVGRGQRADVRLEDAGASRIHLRIERKSLGQYVLSDLGSQNGTRVNGETVASHELRYGDRIDLGYESSFRFVHQDEIDAHLQRAQKLEAVGQLAGGIAHEFNNLLAVIIGNLSIIQRSVEVSDPDMLQSVDDCISAARRGAGLTRDLLSFARHSEVSLEPVDLGPLAQRVAGILRRTLDRNIRIESQVADDVVVLGDPSRLQQVLLNLALNARDAMPDGGLLAVEVSQQPYSAVKDLVRYEAPEWTRITVTDTGTGMDEITKARIFEPFYTTKEVGQGTGLGLALAHGIVRAHKGEINVESEPGKGSTFTLLLPCISMPEPTASASDIDYVAHGARLEGTVLVIDDEPAIRRLAERLLPSLGLTVLTAADGIEGVEMLRTTNETVTHILLDVNMPTQDGEETYGQLRKVDPNVAIIVCSGDPTDERVTRLRDDGAAGWLPKPYEVSELVRLFANT